MAQPCRWTVHARACTRLRRMLKSDSTLIRTERCAGIPVRRTTPVNTSRMRSVVVLRKLLLPGALIAVAALLAGCSGAGSPPPLAPGGSGRACVPAPHIGTPVSIRSVSLPNAHGMTMTEAWLIQLHPHSAQLGMGGPWPPVTDSLWPVRVPAVGGVIQPGKVLQLAFGVIRKTAADGSSDGPVVVYTAGRTTYTLREQVSLAGAPTHCTLVGFGPTASVISGRLT